MAFRLVDLLAPEVQADPGPFLARLAAASPVFEVRPELFVVAGHAAAHEVLASRACSSDRRHSKAAQAWRANAPAELVAALDARRGARPFLVLDPPDHTRLRQVVAPAFRPSVVARLRRRVAGIASELIDAMVEQGSDGSGLEVVAGLARPLPVAVIADLLGIPPSDRPVVAEWSDALAASLEPEATVGRTALLRLVEVREVLGEYLRVLARARGSQSTRDLLGALVEAMGSGVLAEDELVATATLLLAAGHETTTGLIGNAVVRLAGDPAAVTAWRERPGIGASAVEELLRLDGPVQLTARTTLAPISVDGVEIPAGVDVIVLLGAANRDHRVFPGPDRLDLERSPNPQLAFGFGLHHCLGAPLARLEAEVALYELVARLGRLELARAPERRPGVVLRGMRSVWLRPPAQVVRQPAQAARW